MFTKKNVIVAIVCVLGLTAWSGTALAELVGNGGFETGDWTSWTAVEPTTPFPYGAGNAVSVDNLGAGAYQGLYAAHLTKATYGETNPTAPGQYAYAFTVQSAGATTVGLTYTFSFAAKKLSGDANSRLEVAGPLGISCPWQWGDGGPGQLTVPGDGAWHTFSYTGVATGTGDYLAFKPANTAYTQGQSPAALNPIPDEYLLDAVSVTIATPEPSTLVLVATGLFGLLCYAWRKRK